MCICCWFFSPEINEYNQFKFTAQRQLCVFDHDGELREAKTEEIKNK